MTRLTGCAAPHLRPALRVVPVELLVEGEGLADPLALQELSQAAHLHLPLQIVDLLLYLVSLKLPLAARTSDSFTRDAAEGVLWLHPVAAYRARLIEASSPVLPLLLIR